MKPADDKAHILDHGVSKGADLILDSNHENHDPDCIKEQVGNTKDNSRPHCENHGVQNAPFRNVHSLEGLQAAEIGFLVFQVRLAENIDK